MRLHLKRSAVPARYAWRAAGLWLIPLLLVGAMPAHAQVYRTAVGVSGGWSTAGDLTPGMGYETVLATGWMAGAQLERWPQSGRTGWRLNASVASRTMEGTQRDFTVVAADVGPVFRLLPASNGRVVAPFVALGAGLVAYRASGDGEPLGNGRYGSDPVVRLMLAPSLGLDLLTGSAVGLRIEVADQAVFPFVGISPEGLGVRVVHNPGVSAAVQLRLGRVPGPTMVAGSGRELQPALETRPAPPPAAPAAAPPPAESPLYTVQVGAFAATTRAREAAGRLVGTGLPVWLADGDVVAPHLVRVRAGALHSLDLARRLSQRLEREFGLETWIDTVTAEEPVPQNAVLATLRFLLSR
jgi:hypothetical protein